MANEESWAAACAHREGERGKGEEGGGQKGHVAPGAELQLPQLHNRGPGWAGAGHAP